VYVQVHIYTYVAYMDACLRLFRIEERGGCKYVNVCIHYRYMRTLQTYVYITDICNSESSMFKLQDEYVKTREKQSEVQSAGGGGLSPKYAISCVTHRHITHNTDTDTVIR